MQYHINKQKLIFVLLLLTLSMVGFGQFSEDFSDPDLTTGVIWSGDIGEFEVNNQMLQLKAPAAGESTLSTNYMFKDSLRYGIDVFLQFAPSADNALRLYLYHEQADVSIGEALYLQLGESGSADAFTLFHRNASGMIDEIQRFASIPHSSSLSVGVQIEFLTDEQWTFYFDHDGDDVFDDVQPVSFTFLPLPAGFFGIQCTYTSTRVDKFFFDDVYVEKIIADLEGPDLLSVDVISANKIILNFNEIIDGSSLVTNQFLIQPGNINPSSTIWSAANPQQICLLFNTPLINQTSYDVTAIDILDAAGNLTVSQTQSFLVVIPEIIEPGDIIINEIHASPSAITIVANTEFIELLNRSDKILDISDLIFRDATSSVSLPSYTLYPDEHIVIAKLSDIDLFIFTDTVVGVVGLPTLNNSGDILTLHDGTQTIDRVEYSSFWYEDDNKTSGWSLECKNPESVCRGSLNWTASTDPTGGTPGEINSVFSIAEPPGQAVINRVNIFSSTRVAFAFNIEMNVSQLMDQANFGIEPSLTILSSEVQINNGEYALVLDFAEEMQPGQTYELILNTSICACNGQKWVEPYMFKFGLPEPPESGDLRIAEILFSPFSGQSEFIEIVNTSNKIIDINAVWLHFESSTGTTSSRRIASDFQLSPTRYHVLSTNPLSIDQNYNVPFVDQLHQFDLPSLSNSGGVLTLYTFDLAGDSIFIDRGIYSEDLHDPLLDESRGVSLERIQINGPGTDPSNWYSASTLAGGATPTGENSQRINPAVRNANFTLNSPTFSPDSDGFEDVMLLLYEFERPGFIAQAQVYAYDGAPIKKLIDNESLGATGQIVWRGETDEGDRARVGIYYVVIEAFHVDGETIQEKKKIVLARKL